MIVRKIKSSIVVLISYFIGSGVEVLVVDSRRDCMTYIVTFEANPVVNADQQLVGLQNLADIMKKLAVYVKA